MLLVTHQMDAIIAWISRCGLLKQGQIANNGYRQVLPGFLAMGDSEGAGGQLMLVRAA